MPDQICAERDSLERSLHRIKAALRINSSDVELIGIEGSRVRVVFEGRVVESFSSIMLLKIGMERALRMEVPGFGELITEFRQAKVPGLMTT